MNVQESDGIDWLPVVEFSGVEYVVDIGSRAFRQRRDSRQSVGFYSKAGRAMVAAMIGTEWRAFTPKGLWQSEPELVV